MNTIQERTMKKDHSARVEIRHTAILVYNYIRGENVNLEHYFQVFDKGRHSYQDVSLYIDKDTNTLYLPAGVQYWFINKHFGNDIFRKVKPDTFAQVNQIKLRTRPRDPVQEEAIDFCVGGDRYPQNQRSSQIFLNLNTGKGKTYVMIATSAYYSVKTAIIMCSLSWMEQWRDRILEYTNTKEDEIYFISGLPSIVKLFKGIVDHKKVKYFLVSHDTLRAYGDKYGWNRVHELFKYLQIGIKVYDEAHLYPVNIFKIDYFSDVWRTYYLTATPMLSDPFKNVVFQRSFSTVPKINLFNEETDPRTDYQPVLYNSHPTALDLHNCQGPYGFNIIWYANYLVFKPAYYNVLWIVLDWIFETISKEGKILIYIGTNQAIQLTAYWIKYMYPDYSLGIFTSLTPKNEKKEQLDCKIILSTNKSAGAAMDIKNLEVTIDIDDPVKSPVLVRQKLGRTRDIHTTFFDIVDIGFPQLRYYYESKQKIYRKYASRVLEPIHLMDSEIRDRLIHIRAKEEAILKQASQRTNLIQVMEIVEPPKE